MKDMPRPAVVEGARGVLGKIDALTLRQKKIADGFGRALQSGGKRVPSADFSLRLKEHKQLIFATFPDLERRVILKNMDVSMKGTTLEREIPGLLKLVSEDKSAFKDYLEGINSILTGLDESSNYAVIQYIYEALFDVGRTIERKLSLFRQLSSKKELQKIFK